MTFAWIVEEKQYTMVVKVSQYKGVQVELEIQVPLKTLNSKKYMIYYTVTSSLLFKKEVIIETCSFSFELFTNYKFVYTLLNKEARKTQVDKIIVYSDGVVFGGQKIFYKETKFDPFKYRQKIKSMPGFCIDLDDFQKKREEDVRFFPKFLFQRGLGEPLMDSLKKGFQDMSHLLKMVLNSLVQMTNNFFQSQFQILLEEKQIRFDWNHFDKDYFHKILELNKVDFQYKQRRSKGLM